LSPCTECSDPYHSHNAPFAFSVTSLPFAGRLFIDNEPCAKADSCSFVSKHNVLVSSLSSSTSSLVVYTDSSHNPQSGAGYSLIVLYRGRRIRSFTIPLARKGSSFDVEVFAFAHASSFLSQWLATCPHVSDVCIFSDSSSSLKVIFKGTPHPSQSASILFRTNFLHLFQSLPNLRIHISWVPGHKGIAGMKIADSLAVEAGIVLTRYGVCLRTCK